MSTENTDLFGKIDALLGKRAPDALLEKELDIEDFPLLTEVVKTAPEAQEGAERRQQERRQTDRRQRVRRTVDGEQPLPFSASSMQGEADMVHLMLAFEQRLTELFIRQQLRMEEAVRKVIRDELGRAVRPDGGAD